MKTIILLLAVVFLAGCIEEGFLPNYDFKSCSEDSDCILVKGAGCCECYDIINNQHKDIWNDEISKIDCEGIICKPCPDRPIETACVENKCSFAVYDFQSCIEAGNPAMESFPRQCRAGSMTYTEVLEMTIEEARTIAQESECTQQGTLEQEAFYNENTYTWWVEMDLEKEGCNPACVVSAVTRSAEINWRCTGAVMEVPQQ